MKWSDASGDLKRSDKVQSISENSFRRTISSTTNARVCPTSCQVLSFLYILLAHINLFENSYSVFQYILCRTKRTTKVTSCHRHGARTGLNVLANSRTRTDYRCRARIVSPHWFTNAAADSPVRTDLQMSRPTLPPAPAYSTAGDSSVYVASEVTAVFRRPSIATWSTSTSRDCACD